MTAAEWNVKYAPGKCVIFEGRVCHSVSAAVETVHGAAGPFVLISGRLGPVLISQLRPIDEVPAEELHRNAEEIRSAIHRQIDGMHLEDAALFLECNRLREENAQLHMDLEATANYSHRDESDDEIELRQLLEEVQDYSPRLTLAKNATLHIRKLCARMSQLLKMRPEMRMH